LKLNLLSIEGLERTVLTAIDVRNQGVPIYFARVDQVRPVVKFMILRENDGSDSGSALLPGVAKWMCYGTEGVVVDLVQSVFFLSVIVLGVT